MSVVLVLLVAAVVVLLVIAKRKAEAAKHGRAIARAIHAVRDKKPFTPLEDFMAGVPEPPLPAPRLLPHQKRKPKEKRATPLAKRRP